MNESKRNFRPFGSRVGLRVVENKKALEMLLKDDTISEEKLIAYCNLHALPPMYRILIWKILLHILPVHQQSHQFVMQQRKEQFYDLNHALTVMRKINEKSLLHHVYLRAYLLETGEIGIACYHEKWHDLFLVIASSVIKMTDDRVDGYWLTVGIYKKISRYFEKNDCEAELYNTFASVLQKEAAKLHEHLSNVQALTCLPYKKWFLQCYAGTLTADGGLERVWDVVLSGGFSLLPYVAVQILASLERRLLQASSVAAVQDILNETYPEDVGELAACRGIDLWLRYEADVNQT